MGGWRKLSSKYLRTKSPSGRRFGWQSLSIGLTNYGNCLTVYSSDEGLDLSVLLPFRLGHPPLFIPWDDLSEPKVTKIMWVEVVAIEVGLPRLCTLKMSKKVFDRYLDAIA